jgi:hypothetical protein
MVCTACGLIGADVRPDFPRAHFATVFEMPPESFRYRGRNGG